MTEKNPSNVLLSYCVLHSPQTPARIVTQAQHHFRFYILSLFTVALKKKKIWKTEKIKKNRKEEQWENECEMESKGHIE